MNVLMPQLGESGVEGTITRWVKAVGERVEEYEPLGESNTDKVDTEVPSPASGVLTSILAAEGTTVNAGAPLAVIHAEGETAEGPAPNDGGLRQAAPTMAAQAEAAPMAAGVHTAPPATPAPGGGRDRDLGFISPVVARIASEHQIDLYRITGTGQGGRITKKDVLAYLESDRPASAEAAQPAEGPAAPEVTSAAAMASAPALTAVPSKPAAAVTLEKASTTAMPGDGEIMPLTTVRRSIAEHMVASKRTSPHVTTIMEADLSRVVAHRNANKDAYSRDGVNLTFTAYFVAATVAALKEFPLVNSSWSDEGIRLHRAINVGVATSLGDAGLIVPVIKNADGLSLLGTARAVNDLAGRARSRQLKPDDVQRATFTITNHGISGSLFATPIINQPQCGILGVGMMQKRVVVVSDEAGNDSIAIRPMVYLGLTFDHRILDGALADHFLARVVRTLQEWH